MEEIKSTMVKRTLRVNMDTNKILSKAELIHSIMDGLSKISILGTEDVIYITKVHPSKDTLTLECTNGELIQLDIKY